MNKDKLDTLLKAYDKQHNSGEFSTAADFRKRFFKAVEELPAESRKRRKPKLWVTSAVVFAAAAALLIFVIPMALLPESPDKNLRNATEYVHTLMEKLKNIFPERNVGLCLVNDELETFELDEERPRNILINYSVQRVNDGKEIKFAIASSNDNNAEIDAKQAKGMVWIYQPDKKVVNVDTDLSLKLDRDTTIRIKKSNLLRIGKKQFVSEFEYNGRKYQLLQSACRI